MTKIGHTLKDSTEINMMTKNSGKQRIHAEILLNRPLYFKRWYLVEDEVKFCCTLRYEKTFETCNICGFVTHEELPC